MEFKKERFEKLIVDSEKWWNHELDRPIIQVLLRKKDNPEYSRGDLLEMCYNPNVAPLDVAKAYESSFDHNIYLGDAFPCFYMRSTGILGAYLGQKWQIENKHGTIWFQEMGTEVKENIPVLDRQYWLYQRSLDIMKAFQDYFQGNIGIGIANLGGMMDIVESMLGATECLMDLYDDAKGIKELNNAIYDAYEIAYKDQIHLIDLSKTPGYSGWITLLSQKPYFISQCDFCCMVSQEQFDEFIFDTLKKEAELIERPFYHLDGPGAIRHLDRIIECGFIGIQWIPGAGSPELDSPDWDIVYQKIKDHHLLLQVFINGKDQLRCIDHIIEKMGDASQIAFICDGEEEDRRLFEDYLKKYHVM